MDQDVAMGSDGDTPRKPKHPLGKVPRNEEPNELPLPGLGGGGGLGLGRSGHESDRHAVQPGRAGRLLLWVLGRRPKEPGQDG